jgi:hypothetical protein
VTGRFQALLIVFKETRNALGAFVMPRTKLSRDGQGKRKYHNGDRILKYTLYAINRFDIFMSFFEAKDLC